MLGNFLSFFEHGSLFVPQTRHPRGMRPSSEATSAALPGLPRTKASRSLKLSLRLRQAGKTGKPKEEPDA